MPIDCRLMGVDIGAQSIRVCVFDGSGRVLGSFQRSLDIDRPHHGWAEADPETWWHAFIEGLGRAVEQARISPQDISAIGISNMCPSLIAMDGQGRALRPAILYQDQRSLDQVAHIKKKLSPQRTFEITGNRLAAGTYSASSMRWIKDQEPEIYSRTNYFGHANSFLAIKLTGNTSFDPTNASFTGIFETGALESEPKDAYGRWSSELTDAWEIDIAKLPPVVDSWSPIGGISKQAAQITGLKQEVPVAIGAADTACSALAAGVTDPGQGFNTSGSSDVLALCIENPNFDNRFMNRCHAVPNRWLAMGALLSAGAAMGWLQKKILATENYDALNEAAQQVDPGANHVIFLPYMQGERSPIWDPNARGVFFGLSLETTRGHLVRAMMEGTAYALRQNLEIATQNLGFAVNEIHLGGGGAKSDLWCQIKADILNRPLIRLDKEETAVLGAAMLGGIAAGFYRDHDEAVKAAAASPTQIFTPQPEMHRKYEKGYEIFCNLYPQLKNSFHALAAGDQGPSLNR